MSGRNAVDLTRETSSVLPRPGWGEGQHLGHRGPEVTLKEIHELAFRKWVAAGKPSGDSTPFWLEAERDLVEGT